MPLPEIEKILVERYGTAADKAKLIARLSHGAAGWAIGAAQDEMELEDYAERVGKVIGLIDSGYDERFAYAAALALQFARRNGLVEEFLDTLTDFWHDVLLIKLGLGESVTNINMPLELERAAGEFSLAEIRDFIGGIQAAGKQLEMNVSPRLVLEVLMLNMPRSGKIASPRI